jgi:hypothetical protein
MDAGDGGRAGSVIEGALMRRFAMITGIADVLCLSLARQEGPAIDVLWGLAFGWLSYLARVLPRVRIAWDGMATGVFCLALFTVGLHRTLRSSAKTSEKPLKTG